MSIKLKINRDPQNLCPWFADRLSSALAECQALGFRVALFEGFRSPERQEALYAQGRTSRGKIITNARPGQSWHQYGLAADIAYLTPAGQWTWDGDFIRLSPIFIGQGLNWFGPGDAGHYECPASSFKAARQLLESEGSLEGVWSDALKKADQKL